MPAVAAPPKPTADYFLSGADAFGDEGEFVSRAASQSARHWEDRMECLLTQSAVTDAFDYESVPLDKVASIRVAYRFVGDLEPMPYDWDE
jgi:hypothetical protein